jgi:hypothetical protein
VRAMADTRKFQGNNRDPEAPWTEEDKAAELRRNPLLDPSAPVECVVATGSEHHSARPGPGRIWFHPDY